MSFVSKKPHRLPLTSMSAHYVEANKAEMKEAYDYAKGRATSMGFGALVKEKEAPAAKKTTGLLSKTRMLAGQILVRLFSHRKM